MTFEKVEIVDRIEIAEDGSIQVRTKITIKENGVEIGNKFHRYVVAPGADVSNETARVQAVCNAVHSPELIAAYLARLP